MAYVFSKLADALGEDGKQNIFQGAPQESRPRQSPGSFKLTGGGGEAVGPEPVKDTGSSGPQLSLTSGAATQQIAAKNAPVGGAPVFGEIGQAIGSKEKQLQQEATAYGQTAEQKRSKYYGLSGDALQKQVEADIKGGQTADLYGFQRGTNVPAPVEAYKSSVETGGLDVPKTRPELATYLTGKGGPRYTAGMGRLDAALLGKSKDFQEEQQSLQARKEALQAQREKNLGLTAVEQAQVESEYGTTKANIQKALEGLASGVLSAQEGERSAMKQRGQVQPSQEEIDDAYNKALENLKGTTHYRYLDAMPTLRESIDPMKFYSSGYTGDVEDLTSYLDEGERSYYSQIADLLGTTPQLGGPVGYQSGFDQAALEAALLAEYNRRLPTTTPIATDAARQKIIDAAISSGGGAGGGWAPAETQKRQKEIIEDVKESPFKPVEKALKGEKKKFNEKAADTLYSGLKNMLTPPRGGRGFF